MMQERSGTVIGALALLLLLLPLGSIVHVSPRFPGSLVGSLVGVCAVVLLLLAAAHALFKRVPALHRTITRRIPPRTLLALHIYLGLLGALLALVHSAHKFNSPLGISLTGTLLLVLISGYVGRYVLNQVAIAVRGRRSDLAVLKTALTDARHVLEPPDIEATAPQARPSRWGRLLLVPSVTAAEASDAPRETSSLALSVADMEFAIRSEEAANRLLSASKVVHIVLSILFLALLALHIWAGLYYGLRGL